MKINVIAGIIVATQFVGCSSTLTVVSDRSVTNGDEIAIVGLNKKIAGQTVTVAFVDGKSLLLRNVTVTEDSCLFFKEGATEQQAIALSQVTLIERKDYIAGGLTGFLLGGTGGLVVGGAFGSIMGMEGFRVVPAAYGAATGAIAGTIVGALIGNKLRYEIAIKPRYSSSKSCEARCPMQHQRTSDPPEQ